MIKIYFRNLGLYALYLAVCIGIGAAIIGVEGYFTMLATPTNMARLILATILAIVFNFYAASWEYDKKLHEEFSDYIAERIKTAKVIKLEDLEDL
ncbi:MAG: hypothetical protein J6Y02_01355 [Pseudobutyrivibrio sp.]|nr:hypothetical protein [Pseudobutyrivibrio sp.]